MRKLSCFVDFFTVYKIWPPYLPWHHHDLGWSHVLTGFTGAQR